MAGDPAFRQYASPDVSLVRAIDRRKRRRQFPACVNDVCQHVKKFSFHVLFLLFELLFLFFFFDYQVVSDFVKFEFAAVQIDIVSVPCYGSGSIPVQKIREKFSGDSFFCVSVFAIDQIQCFHIVFLSVEFECLCVCYSIRSRTAIIQILKIRILP